MPYTAPFSGQNHKWFSILLFMGLPFLVLYKWVKGDLPHIQDLSKKGKLR